MDTLSSLNRISGLATGLDTDSMVKQLMKAERIPLDKLSQKKQLMEWQRDSYREMTNLLRGFQDDFFNVLKSSSNMLSPSVYKKFTVESTDATGAATTAVTATGNADASAGTQTIVVKELAKAAHRESSGRITAPIVGTVGTPAATDFTDGNTNFVVTLDGVTKVVTLATRNYGTVGNLISDPDGIQQLINNAFGAGKVTVSETTPGSGELKFSADNNKLAITSSKTNDALGKLQLTSGLANSIDTSQTLDSLANKLDVKFAFNADGKLKFKINGQEFAFDKTDKLGTVINTINSSSAGVELRYNQLTDTFSLKTKQTGAATTITTENMDGTNFFDAIKIATGTVSNGNDAKFSLDGGLTDILRSDNVFTIQGVTYTLNKLTDASGVTVSLKQDVDGVFNNIKSFIDKYNDLIGKINAKIDETKYREYQPLTDDQKESMKDDDIKKWEAKAKSGLLRSDPLLQKVISDMRSALFDSIAGVKGNLSDIGITTGTWETKGQLVIDETKLKNAIQSDPDKIMNMFSQKSSIDYSPDLSSTDRSNRYKNEGIVQRWSDILNDNIRITRNNDGRKGLLIEKAGLEGDFSQFSNLIDKEINQTATKISNLNKKLIEKEQKYYDKFAALETAIQKMNSQQGWLQQQFGGN